MPYRAEYEEIHDTCTPEGFFSLDDTMGAMALDLQEACADLDRSRTDAEETRHNVHELAREGNELDAQIEKFFDDVLIDDIQQTPLVTIEGVIRERHERDELHTRLRARAQEMLQARSIPCT